MHHLLSLKWPLLWVHKDRNRTDYWSKRAHLCTSSLADHFDHRLPHRTNSLPHFKQTRIKGHPSSCWTTVITKGNARSTEVPASCDRLATCSESIPVFCPATVGLNSITPTDKKQTEDMEQRTKCTYNKDLSHIRLQNAQRPTINRIFLFTPWRAAAVNHGRGGGEFILQILQPFLSAGWRVPISGRNLLAHIGSLSRPAQRQNTVPGCLKQCEACFRQI